MLMKTDFFDDLRTKKQLGYIVAAQCTRLAGVVGVDFFVQSRVEDALGLSGCIDAFLARCDVTIFLRPNVLLLIWFRQFLGV